MARNHVDGDVKMAMLESNPALPVKPSMQNGDLSKRRQSYAMDKDELMWYANDPVWRGVRWFLFISFWLIWIAMVVISVVIVVHAPKCPAPPPRKWWQESPIYKIHVPTFIDGDGDGKGDIIGVVKGVEYIKDALQVDAVWLSSVFDESMDEQTDGHMPFENAVGNIKDLENLIEALTDKEVKIIVDFIPNYTSRRHPWFSKSEGKEEPFTDYYVWRDRNELMDHSRGSGWFFSEQRNQSYLYHQSPLNPVLNLNNDKIIQLLKEAVQFWLDKGVDGIKVDVPLPLTIQNEKTTIRSGKEWLSVETRHDAVWFGNNVFQEFRQLLDQYDDDRILILDSRGTNTSFLMHYTDSADMILDSHFLDSVTKEQLTGSFLKDKIASRLSYLSEEDLWPGWMIGNSEESKIAAMFGKEFVNHINMIIMSVPGTPMTVNGDELGLTTKTQLRKIPKSPNSHTSVYKQMSDLRRTKALLYGEIDFPVINQHIFSLTRVVKGAPGLAVILNFGDETTKIDLSDAKYVPAHLTLHRPMVHSGAMPILSSDAVELKGKEGVVVTFVPKVESA